MSPRHHRRLTSSQGRGWQGRGQALPRTEGRATCRTATGNVAGYALPLTLPLAVLGLYTVPGSPGQVGARRRVSETTSELQSLSFPGARVRGLLAHLGMGVTLKMVL